MVIDALRYERISPSVTPYLWNLDRAIEKLVETIKELGIAEETLIAILSDHGESLGEHGIWFDYHGLYEVSIRIPLIFYSRL